jgi:hypothetical protein
MLYPKNAPLFIHRRAAADRSTVRTMRVVTAYPVHITPAIAS